MERRNRYPVLDVASALAELDAHFGDKAGEALDCFLAYRDRIGKPIRSIGAFFARGIDGPLHQRISNLLPTASPTGLSDLCPDCGGGGWILDDPGNSSTARKCPHTRRAATG